MSKKQVKKMSGVLASIFAHTGHISKKDAQEISNLDDSAFEEVFLKASRIAERFLQAGESRMDHFAEDFGKEIEEYVHAVVGHITKS